MMVLLFWYINQVLASFAPIWVGIALGVSAIMLCVLLMTKQSNNALFIVGGLLLTLLTLPFTLSFCVVYEAANAAALPGLYLVLDGCLLAALVSTPFLLVAETRRIEYRSVTRCCALSMWLLAWAPSQLGIAWGIAGFITGACIAIGMTLLAALAIFPDFQDKVHEEISARVQYSLDPIYLDGREQSPVICNLREAKRDAEAAGTHYLGIALVTQGPALPLAGLASRAKGGTPLDPSWLVSFFQRRPFALHPEVFGVEIYYDGNAAQYGFFARGASEEEAWGKALAIKRHLEGTFDGLECQAFARPVTCDLLRRQVKLHELRLPRPFYKKLPILERWGTLIVQKKIPVQLFVLFQEMVPSQQKLLRLYATHALATALPRSTRALRDSSDQVDAPALLETWSAENVEPLYRVQIYLHPRLANAAEAAAFQASVQGYRAMFRNLGGRVMTVSPASTAAWTRVLKLRHMRGRETTAKALDLGFPPFPPLRRAALLPSEKFHPLPDFPTSLWNRIIIGRCVASGRQTAQLYSFLIDNLKRHLLVLGIPGTGKTYLLSSIVQQLRLKAPRVGILVVNIAKANQEGFYGVPPDRVFRAHSPRFQLPYFSYPPVAHPDWNKVLEQCAKNLALAMGLGGWDLPYKKLVDALSTSLAREHQVPQTLEALFALFEDALKSRDYGSAQAKIVTSILNRVDFLRGQKDLLHAASVLPPGMHPEWLDRWARGDLVYLDFQPASEDERLFYLYVLFNLIETYAQHYSPSGGVPLRLAVVCDEIHSLTSWSAAQAAGQEGIPPQAAEVNRVFRTHLTEDRSRGIGYIIADQQVAGLPESAFEIPAIQVFFTVGRASAHAITSNPEEQALLTLLEERRAIVHDAIESQHFMLHTLDVALPEQNDSPPALPPPAPALERIKALAVANPETIDPAALVPDTQACLRAYVTTLVEQDKLESALKTLWFLWYNATHAIIPPPHAPAPGTPILDLLSILDALARPDAQLRDAALATFETQFDSMDAIRGRACEGTLQSGDISAFDHAMEAITRVYRTLLAEHEVPALAPQCPLPDSPGPISEAEILRDCRAWRPECLSPAAVQHWRARALDLAKQGNAQNAFAITYFLWHHLYLHLMDVGDASGGSTFRHLGTVVWCGLPASIQTDLGPDFLALFEKVDRMFVAPSEGVSPQFAPAAAMVWELFLSLEKFYLQIVRNLTR